MKSRKEFNLLPIFSLSVTFFILFNKNVLTSSVKESSGTFMLVETPDGNENPDLLVVAKPDGKKSLIEVDSEVTDATIENKEGNDFKVRYHKNYWVLFCYYELLS